MIDLVRHVLRRDIRALKRELEAYPDEKDIWKTPPGITNPAGTLALHLAGNLRYLIGARLGGSGYVRDRDAEFSRRDVARAELLAELDRVEADVEAALDAVTPEQLEATYPGAIAGLELHAGEFVVHLLDHLGYHLGQVDYHRRMVTGSEDGVDAMSLAALGSARPEGDPA